MVVVVGVAAVVILPWFGMELSQVHRMPCQRRPPAEACQHLRAGSRLQPPPLSPSLGGAAGLLTPASGKSPRKITTSVATTTTALAPTIFDADNDDASR